jgi:parallel beta-helix repeat protein
LEHSLGSGSPDAGFYVGGCYPCKTILDQVIAEGNIGGGYSGTNAGGELYIINSLFRKNYGGGIAPNTFDVEPHAPQRENVIVGNTIVDNWGNGISIDGGNKNLVTRNYLSGNRRNGILVHATKDRNYYPATDNTIRDNVILNSGRADLAMSGLGNIGNCFAGNVHRTTIPWGLEILQGCRGVRLPVVGDMNAYLSSRAGRNNLFSPRRSFGDEWKRMPHPEPQPQLPGGADAPVRPPLKPFESFPLDVDKIQTPKPPVGAVVAATGRGQ